MKYSSNIKQLRESLQLTPVQLAEASGLSLDQFTELEEGTAKTINLKALLGLAKELGTDVDMLFFSDNCGSNSFLGNKKRQAAQVLVDEIYDILRDAKLAKYTIGNLVDEYFEREADGSAEWREALSLNYGCAQTQVNILLDYVCKVVDSLSNLEATSLSSAKKQGGAPR